MIKKIFLILDLLLIQFFFITSNYNAYNNHFSIYFNKDFNILNIERELGDESINHLLYNNVFTSVRIGDSLKEILLSIFFNSSDIIINSDKYLDSITYNKESIKNGTIIYKDKMEFTKDGKVLDLNFSINIKDINNSISFIGLGLKNINNNKISFINQLKDNHIIEKRYFSILFKENSITGDSITDGQILFGLLPHELTTRYNPNNLFWSPIIDSNKELNDLKWEIKFDSVYYNDDNEPLNVKNAEFDIALNLIIGPEEFRQKILNSYFERFINEKLCKEELFFNKKDYQFYITYSCKMHYDIEDFPTLNFYSKDLNKTFVMNYDQLLCVYKGRVFLKVVFKKYAENKKWILGRAFMEVFPIIFDVDNKKVGYYKMVISESHPTLVFLFFFVIAVIFGFYIYQGIKYENQKKEELIKMKKDDDYNNKNNQENNKEKNSGKIKNEKINESKKEEKDMDESTKLLNHDNKK